MVNQKAIEVSDQMIEAGIREYLRSYREEDDPRAIVKAIFEAMKRAQPSLPDQVPE